MRAPPPRIVSSAPLPIPAARTKIMSPRPARSHRRSPRTAKVVSPSERVDPDCARRRRFVGVRLSAATAAAFWTSPVLFSIAHGEGVSPQFEESFYDAVSDYVSTRSADAFASQLENAVNGDRIPGAAP